MVDYSSGYDAVGNQTSYSVKSYDNGDLDYTTDYTIDYKLFDSYKRDTEVSTSDLTGFSAGTTNHYYDYRGNLKAVRLTPDGIPDYRYFENNRQGLIVERVNGAKKQNYYYANDRATASLGNISFTEFDYNHTPISNKYPGSIPGQYVVNQGDTLQSIAQTVYGDGSLWYIIAEANGLGGNGDLVEGQTLTISQEILSRNTSETFSPYNLGEIVGDTTPLPIAPPPPTNHCGTISLIIQVIVTIVVAYYAGPEVGYAAGAAIGAAAGNASGQAVRIAGGEQNSFSGSEILTSAAVAYVTAGVTNGLNFTDPLAAGIGPGQVALGAAAGYATNYTVNRAFGNDPSFSWRELGSAVAGAALASEAFGNQTGSNTDVGDTTVFNWGKVARETASAYAGSAITHLTRKAFGIKGVHWDNRAVTANAFGSGVANSVIQLDAISEDKAGVVSKDITRTVREAKNKGASEAEIKEIIRSELGSSGVNRDEIKFVSSEFTDGIGISLNGKKGDFDFNISNSAEAKAVQSGLRSFLGNSFSSSGLTSVDLALSRFRIGARQFESQSAINGIVDLGRASVVNSAQHQELVQRFANDDAAFSNLKAFESRQRQWDIDFQNSSTFNKVATGFLGGYVEAFLGEEGRLFDLVKDTASFLYDLSGADGIYEQINSVNTLVDNFQSTVTLLDPASVEGAIQRANIANGIAKGYNANVDKGGHSYAISKGLGSLVGSTVRPENLATGAVASEISALNNAPKLVPNKLITSPTTIKTNGIAEQASHLADMVPGMSNKQATALLEAAFEPRKPVEVVIGGSRVRNFFGKGEFRLDSDLDIGFNATKMKNSKINRILNSFDEAGDLVSERDIKIFSGNKPKSGIIESPQEFFQRSGIREFPPSRAGEPFVPSGYISINPDGTITLVPPGM